MPFVMLEFWAVFAFIMGTMIGSFLNVVVWRLPRGESLSHPGSHCPHCNRPLSAWENIPLVSFLALRARCRTCRAPISWRYFTVELLTGLVFLALFLHFGPSADSVAYCLFAAALIAAFFIDLELFIIPDEVNTFALLVGIGRDVWGIVAGEPAHALLWGWLPRSIAGAVICAAVFVLIQVIGQALFHKDAMGDGDVKLARAIGALLPLSLALVSFLMAIALGALIGGGALIWQSRHSGVEPAPDEPADEPEPEVTPFRDVLLGGLMYLTFADVAVQIAAWFRVPAAVRVLAGPAGEEITEEDDDFVPGPTHIPFGPYMVAGALLSVFVGHALIVWYLAWAGFTKTG